MPGDSDIKAAIAAAVPHAPQAADDLALAGEPRNDLGNARRLLARHGRDLAVIGDERIVWLVWDGSRWAREGGAPEALKRAQATSEAMQKEAEALERHFSALEEIPAADDGDGAPGPDPGATPGATPGPKAAGAASSGGAQNGGVAAKERRKASAARVLAHRKFAIGSGNVAKSAAMLAAAVPMLRVATADWDARPFLLNVENGTLDLEATDAEGKFQVLRPDRAHRITRLAAVRYEPDAACPAWERFLARILPDEGLRVFIQTWLGYCLTGDTSEQKLVIQQGSGANGKSTLTETVAAILGDYAVSLDVRTFMHDERRRGSDATPDLIRLPGARLVTASEPEQGDRISESLVKTITGSERVTARPLFKEQIEFDPQFKLMLGTNEKPVIRGQDEGIWRRVLLLPFTVMIPKAERVPPRIMRAQLLAEAAGIFNWMLDGYRIWRERGLIVPPAIEEATAQYRAESDPIGEFLKAATVKETYAREQSARLYAVYAAWCKANAVDARSHTAFGRRLSSLGYIKEVVGVTFYKGLRIVRSDFGLDGAADDTLGGREPADGL